jgi:hypothetical protein
MLSQVPGARQTMLVGIVLVRHARSQVPGKLGGFGARWFWCHGARFWCQANYAGRIEKARSQVYFSQSLKIKSVLICL